MAEIQESGGGGKSKGKKRAKKMSVNVDMTPMVDLMCLLITFFMLTAAFSKPKSMEIQFPEKLKGDDVSNAPQIDKDRAFHIILTEDDKILWYEGLADPTAASLPSLQVTDFSNQGIRRILLERNKDLFTKISELENDILTGAIDVPRDSVDAMKRKLRTDDNTGPIVLIKATDNVRYKNMVDIVDEMAITNIARYSIVDINIVEQKMVQNYLVARASGGASSNN
jgi:biopolymer transport protein ExbD